MSHHHPHHHSYPYHHHHHVPPPPPQRGRPKKHKGLLDPDSSDEEPPPPRRVVAVATTVAAAAATPPKSSNNPQIAAAYKEAKARGLPDGWTCTIDKRNRRKWTAPNNGRSCDSIPKALAISVDLGLLPPDTKIVSGKRKRTVSPKGRKAIKKKASSSNVTTASSKSNKESASDSAAAQSNDGDKKPAAIVESKEEEEEEPQEREPLEPPPEPLDPETSLDCTVPHCAEIQAVLPQSVHWDPTSADGSKVGWKVRVAYGDNNYWAHGRIVRYDPHSHKHKLLLYHDDDDDSFTENPVAVWIWLRNQQHNLQIATRMVWAHVKGYAWWPALVMETNVNNNNNNTAAAANNESSSKPGRKKAPRGQHPLPAHSKTVRPGYVQVEFFGSAEVSILRDAPESIRPFVPHHLDPVVAKHKKKRNKAAFAAACLEYRAIQQTRNAAAVFYARAALMASRQLPALQQHAASSASPTAAAAAADHSQLPYQYVGQRVQVFRSDVNYPAGDTLIGQVRKYSPVQKKWLVAYEPQADAEVMTSRSLLSDRPTVQQYAPSWINLLAKECALRILSQNDDDQKKMSSKTTTTTVAAVISDESLVPFLVGFQADETENTQDAASPDVLAAVAGKNAEKNNKLDQSRERALLRLLKERCRGCVDYLPDCGGSAANINNNSPVVLCQVCHGQFHIGCFDPPLSVETWKRLATKDASATPSVVCAQCLPCRGCYQKDASFGSHVAATPSMLSLTPVKHTNSSSGGSGSTATTGNQLHLCWPCRTAYEDDRFCPNCAHTWDDVRFQMINRQIEFAATNASSSNTTTTTTATTTTGRGRGRKKSRTTTTGGSLLLETVQDTELPLALGSFTGDDEFQVVPAGAAASTCPAIPVSSFYPETAEWGYTEVDMLVCDNCNVWVHAGCSGITEQEYEDTSDGNHPIYSQEFLCRQCCRARCRELIHQLQLQDVALVFSEPVSERDAPNYLDVISTPMDLQTMLQRADADEYLNYAWVRELFELMVLNALTFNKHYTKVWHEAQRYYNHALDTVFKNIGKAAPPGKYAAAVQKRFDMAEDARKKEVDRVQVDESVEKKDLVAGTIGVISTTLPELRESPPDQKSCVPFNEVDVTPVDAFYNSWMDCCYTCGSCGAADTMLFCVDCGEAFHSFCVDAPIHSMNEASISGWRCPNCKICEISGEVPQDETRMLYCEMCDRGFCLDLLDPPLSSAPPGLWICGQCVDCKSCGNKAEPSGASLRHWSRFPDKCYRCGGCEGIADHCSPAVKCQVCVGILRTDDADVAVCGSCESKVHARCDSRAQEHLRTVESASRSQRAQKEKTDDYACPACSKVSSQDAGNAVNDKQILAGLASWGVGDGELLQLGETDSIEDIQRQLADAMDWKVREQWRHEYLATIRDGICIYTEARKKLGEARLAPQKFLSEAQRDIPDWKLHRALRFIVLVGRMKLDERGCSLERIDAIVLVAKLAASFIDVTCRSLGRDASRAVAYHGRVLSLLVSPTDEGTYEPPADPIRFDDSVNADSDAGPVDSNPSEASSVAGKDAASAGLQAEAGPDAAPRPKMASPLCGWNEQIPGGRNHNEWKDPRECCLCHICGDDDAGLIDVPEPEKADGEEIQFSPLGRLLPMYDGYWVHTACALWSSEVWEAPTDGLVHSVEKARSRGAQLKCFGCGRPGATVGCCKSNCPFNYHFPCAKVCGAVFTENQRVYCANHKTAATNILVKESFEHMKALLIDTDDIKKAPVVDKEASEAAGKDLCSRVGALTVHSLGTIVADSDKFHSENYITPKDYIATRVFWSFTRPRTRTVYVLKVEQSPLGRPEFVVLPGDNPSAAIRGNSVSSVYVTLLDRVKKVNLKHFSPGNLLSRRPVIRRTRKKAYGLNGPQFFGFGLDHIRKKLESSPGAEAVAVPLTTSSPRYRFCFIQPDMETLLDLKRKRAAVKAEQALENSSGCARTEGIKAVTKSGGSGRITRALVRSAEEDVPSSSNTTRKDEKGKADRHLRMIKYRRMKSVPIEERLVARRSHIHGWGLFTKLDVHKDDPIVEYMGEIIRQPIGDQRERAYEISGEGSCYMFRLDMSRIVDATMIGCMARFMNHSCDPNAYAKIITVDTDQGPDRKIVVFANRDIATGEEITYDYKFPVEDGSLRCSCGAPNCIGRLN